MCRTFHSYQPDCHCINVHKDVVLCSLYSGLPENRDKMKFNAKLITGHARGLDHLFNGVNYMSADQAYDLMPQGLECPEVVLHEEESKRGPCPLCENPGVLKFLAAKGIQYDPEADIALIDRQDEAAEGSAEDPGESSRGRPSKASRGEPLKESRGKPLKQVRFEPLDNLAGSSDEMEGVDDSASQARVWGESLDKLEGSSEEMEGVEDSASRSRDWKGHREKGERSGGGPDEWKSASMMWD